MRTVSLPAPVLTRLAAVFGPPKTTRPLGANVWMVEVPGRTVVAKLGPGRADEADGLRRLAAVVGGPPVPEVLHADAELLVVTAVEHGRRGPGHAESLGRGLARLHRVAAAHWGGGSSWIGPCRVDPSPRPDAATFYGIRLGALASRCGLEANVSPVVAKLGELLPPEGPAVLHGDLWWGNVLFGTDGRAWLIDPSVHGGHPEEDLAMLALFGEVPERLLGAYREERPLSPGWRERVPLFQLYPLLVHSVLFGGSYRVRAEATARRFA